MSYLSDAKVGDKLTVLTDGWRGKDIARFVIVTRISGKKILTDDGGAWKPSGYQWGSATHYGDFAIPYKPEHEDRLREEQKERTRRKLAREIEDTKWRELPLETLLRVQDALSPKQEAAHAN